MIKSPTKLLLSYLREGNFAHPGEINAIELVMQEIKKDAHQRILDVSCGLGGTAHYLQQNGWGKVVGIDIDKNVLLDAKMQYPDMEFHHCNVMEVDQHFFHQQFDVIYLLSAFFCFTSQLNSLAALSKVAAENCTLAIFDYASLSKEKLESPFSWSQISRQFQPIELDIMKQMLKNAGWTFKESRDITPQFEGWYEDLLERFDQKKSQAVLKFGEDIFNRMYEGFHQLLKDIKARKIGGIILYATQ